jgi:hypothetical protein
MSSFALLLLRRTCVADGGATPYGEERARRLPLPGLIAPPSGEAPDAASLSPLLRSASSCQNPSRRRFSSDLVRFRPRPSPPAKNIDVSCEGVQEGVRWGRGSGFIFFPALDDSAAAAAAAGRRGDGGRTSRAASSTLAYSTSSLPTAVRRPARLCIGWACRSSQVGGRLSLPRPRGIFHGRR